MKKISKQFICVFFSFSMFFIWPVTSNGEQHACFAISPYEQPGMTIEVCTQKLSSVALSDDQRSRALSKRGIAYRQIDEFARSVEDLEKSIALSPDTSNMRMLAWTYREMDRFADAEELYTEVLKTDDHWQGWLSRCVVRQDMERFDRSLADCKESLRQDPDNLDSLYFTARAYNFLDQGELAKPLTVRAMELAPDDPRYLVEHIWALHLTGQTSLALVKAREGLEKYTNHEGLLFFLSESQ